MRRTALMKRMAPWTQHEEEVLVKVIVPGYAPVRATSGSSCLDLLACLPHSKFIEPGHRLVISCGFAIEVPAGYEAQVRSRSGLARDSGVVVANAPGTIDSDYRGEVKVILQNSGGSSYLVRPGDRIAQMAICPVVVVKCREVGELSKTKRGYGGFGSTGRSDFGGE